MNIKFMCAGVLSVVFSLSANAILPNPNLPVASNAQTLTLTPGTPPPLTYEAPKLSMAEPNTVRTKAPNETSVMTSGTSQQDLQTVINAFIVSRQGTQETLTAVTQNGQAKSGDIIEYRGYIVNKNLERIRSMTVLLDIPDGVELVGGIEPGAVVATVDGMNFYRTPLRADMGQGVQDVPLSFYKALRWEVEDIGPKGTAVVKYRAKLK